jgi:uroporphyrinogen-III decarboxylase
LGPDTPILGNVDPVAYLLEGTPEAVRAGLAECHAIVGDRYVVGPGCEVPPGSPPENVRAIAEYAAACAK